MSKQFLYNQLNRTNRRSARPYRPLTTTAIILLCLVLLLLVAGCAASLETPWESSPTEISALPTDTVTPLPTPSASLLPTDTATAAPVPSTTPTIAVAAGPTVSGSDVYLPMTTKSGVASATATPTMTSDSVLFAVIGDFGLANPAEEDVATLVHSWDPDLIITTGDNNYPDGEAETIDKNIGQFYADYIYPYLGEYPVSSTLEYNRFFPSLGNHDYKTTNAQPYLDYFTLPGNERYYDFVWGPVHFFAINSLPEEPDGIGADSVQAMWLQQALAASTSPWKLVYMHVPPYSSGMHGSAEVMQWPYLEWGASAVLAGHDHIYERLFVDGLTYFVNGLGGHPSIYRLNDVIVPGSQIRFRDDYGAMRVEATATEITFEFITRAGALIDTYTLTAQ